MAMAMAVLRPFHLAVICLALLPHTTTLEPAAAATIFHLFHPHRATNITTALPPYASVLTMASTGAGRPASSHPDRYHAPPSPPTRSDASPPPGLDVSAVASKGTTAPPHVHVRAAAVDAIVPTPGGVTCTCSATPSTKKALLDALPLLAIPFLPPPLAALVVLSAMASPVGACAAPDADCDGLTHATCAIYPYNGTIDRTHPVGGRRSVCAHPLCHADSDMRARSVAHAQLQGRRDDPIHAYCTVRSLEKQGDAWLIHPAHLPVADPDAVVASGGDVCYVELAHLDYREGYYIRCPVCDCRRVPFLCCTEFPHEAVASAVWEHRRMRYRGTVGPQFGRYNNGTAGP